MSQYTHLSEPLSTDSDLISALSYARLQQLQATKQSQVPPPDIHTLRKGFNLSIAKLQEIERDTLPNDSEYRVEEYDIPVDNECNTEALGQSRETFKVRCYIPTPNGAKSEDSKAKTVKKPVLVWFHAGGFIIGNLETEDYFLRRICVSLGIVIVNVDYRLAPEHVFPASLNDCHSAVKWVINNSFEYWNISPTEDGIILGGCSAGGNASAALAIILRDEPFNDVKVKGQLLQMPLTIHPEDGKTSKWNDQLLSLEQNKDSTGLGKPQIDNILKLLQPPPNDPRFSVALASSHRNLPPAYIQIGGCDPLRDDGFLYERILKESGVKTKTDVYPGLPHRGHVQFPSTKIAQRLEEDLKVGLTWLMEEKE